MIKYAYITKKGPCHDENEDTIVFGNRIFNNIDVSKSGLSLFNDFKLAVFDGVGGANCGEIASRICAQAFVKYCKPKLIQERNALYNMLQCIQNELIKEQEILKNDMMSTYVSVFSYEGQYVFSNIGDSRAYLISNGEIKQYSYDDTYRNKLIKEGQLSIEEINKMKIAHAITKCFGTNDFNKREAHSYFVERPSETNYILLMSDGVSDLVSENELLTLVNQYKKPNTIVKEIENLVIERGAHDNYSIMIVKD